MYTYNFKSSINLYKCDDFSNSVNDEILDIRKYNKDIVSVDKIGLSIKRTPILSIKLGKGPIKVFINGTHHAREAITTVLILDQIKYILSLYKNNSYIYDISIKDILDKVTFIFVPLVNPDGADLVLSGNKCYRNWKANVNGVDLNRNYPTTYPDQDTVLIPGFKGYPGLYSFSEPETIALKYLTEKYLFDGAISYHSSGEEIYWQFNQLNEERDLKIANKISKETNYTLLYEEKPNIGSGYKDWFIENYQKPSLTIEVSPYVGENKVPIENYKKIFQDNKNVPIIFANEILNSIYQS